MRSQKSLNQNARKIIHFTILTNFSYSFWAITVFTTATPQWENMLAFLCFMDEGHMRY